jgi:radical SAM superfamily enzyme YgiQ (UPF0313 family)
MKTKQKTEGSPSVVLISLYDHDAFGLRNMHGLLKKNGFKSSLIFFKELLWKINEPSENEINLLINKIKELNPTVIGFSVRSPFLKIATDLTERLKPLNKLVIWGNIHPTVKPDECIKYADMICIGDGEFPMLKLMKNLKDKKDFSNIKNLWVKKNNKIKKNPIEDLNQDLDSVTFYDFSTVDKYYINEEKLISFDPKLKYSQYDIMVGRGCPYACAYCTNSYLHKLYKDKGCFLRKRSVKKVIEELVEAKNKLDIKEVYFYDEVFVLDKKWLDDFLKEYKVKINLPFSLCLHPNIVTEEIVGKLKHYGLERVGIGIQSGSQRVRYELFNRFVSDEKILEVAKIFNKFKVMATYDIILDNPYETEADMKDGINLLLKLKRPYNLNVFSLVNLPKTDLTERMIKDNINPASNLFNWKMDINKKREKKKQIYNLKMSLFSKSFFPKFLIRDINDKTVLFLAVKASNFTKLGFMAFRLFLAGKINIALLRYYLRNYRKFSNFQR